MKRSSHVLPGLIASALLAFSTLRSHGQEPANDLFVNAGILLGAQLDAAGTTIGAGREPGEPLQTADAAGHTVWYSWTAPSNGTVTILVGDSNGTFPYPFRFGIYTGDSVSSLVSVSVNSASGLLSSQLFTSVLTGQTYRIAVDSSAQIVEKPFKLQLGFVSAPSNDSFSGRSELSGILATDNGTTDGAASEPGEPLLDGSLLHQTVWWSWTAPDDGVVFLSMTGSCPGEACAPAMAVFIGKTLPGLSVIATNLGSGSSRSSTVRFDVVKGRQYQIRASDAPSLVVDLTLGFHDLRIQLPANDSSIETGQDVILRLSDLPSRLSGQIHHVDFVTVNSVSIGSADGPPFEYIWKNVLPGEHFVGVIALDSGENNLFIPGVHFFVTTSAGSASLKMQSAHRAGGIVSIMGTYGTHYIVERSTDLIQWGSSSEGWLLDQPTLLSDPGPVGPGNVIIDPTRIIPSVFFRVKVAK